MPKIIKDGVVVDDQWQLIEEETDSIPDGAVIVPLSVWESQKASLASRDQLGIWLDSDQSPSLITDDLTQFAVIAINFPAFADGRGFTYARELREQHKYEGEVRAIGGFMRDQLFYLKRCGFNAFALQGYDLDEAVNSLSDFSDSYQAAIDEPQPLFRRRSRV